MLVRKIVKKIISIDIEMMMLPSLTLHVAQYSTCELFYHFGKKKKIFVEYFLFKKIQMR